MSVCDGEGRRRSGRQFDKFYSTKTEGKTVTHFTRDLFGSSEES